MKGVEYQVMHNTSVAHDEFCDKVRAKLKLEKKDLPNQKIKSLCKLSNTLISDWLVNNADGFKIKDNGFLAISKYLPRCMRDNKEETVEFIQNMTNVDQKIKDMLLKRVQKSITFYKNRDKRNPNKKIALNISSLYYIYRVLFFNARNCKTEKAKLFEFSACDNLEKKMMEKIFEGKEYYEWQFSDFYQPKYKRINRKVKREEKEKQKKENG